MSPVCGIFTDDLFLEAVDVVVVLEVEGELPEEVQM